MAKDGEVEFNDAEIQRILNSPQMAAEVKRVCNAIMARSRTLAPVDSGDYVGSFRIVLKPRKKYRIVGYVVNDSEHAMVVEMKYGVMTKARRAR